MRKLVRIVGNFIALSPLLVALLAEFSPATIRRVFAGRPKLPSRELSANVPENRLWAPKPTTGNQGTAPQRWYSPPNPPQLSAPVEGLDTSRR
jgi:hypothetical protein